MTWRAKRLGVQGLTIGESVDTCASKLRYSPIVNNSLNVPGLAEKRPSVILGDQIRVRHTGGKEYWWGGYVHKVKQTEVLLRFDPRFNAYKGQTFDVRFTLGRTPLRRMHQALDVAWNPPRLLFPDHDDVQLDAIPTPTEISSLRPFNRILDSNPAQMLAVTSIVNQKRRSVPFIIFGP
jgi:helicase MOV-10